VHNRLSFYGLLLTSFLFLTANTATAGYVAEIIVFEPTSTQGWLDEYWQLLPAKLDAQEKETVLGSSTSLHHLLGAEQLSLKETAKRLTSTGEYRILAHTAWSQPTADRQRAYTTELAEGISSSGLPLQAKIKLYKQKFEHIDIEVQLERKMPKGVIPEFAQKHSLSVTDVGETWRFRLQESRKVKLGELQYFDHPMFGILLIIREGGA
jgi:hypothetical protein